ncbi:hypothetical protein MSAN_01942000 [Mycena sanguinolenta]|uniref:Epidermal growth factor receptor-like transmembrane-juxtamembrane segment domain-containing protein n=1 Tax=Mycena sanguinolenta TaxID=230812 RepID=A0A8H6XQG2_9AGAR|nr:hypothetical protein MSAN_01942000 [Mycena sanguinolenta]
MANLVAAVLVLAVPALVDAYSWSFNSQPTQCGNVSITVSGGTPPYQVLVVPYGSSPLPNNIEARKIQDEGPFSSADISFKLNFPENSQFVAVMTDSTGFASGGTSVGVLVGSSGDASCFDASQNVQPEFVYSIVPGGVITQCEPTRIWWDPNAGVQGTPKFQGVIPGGISFEIPQGPITQVAEEGTGFNWTAPLRGMTTFLLVAGDDRGNGTGGSTLYIVSSGTNNDNSCLNSTSPSSTAGSPAGGMYPTGSGGGTSSTGSSGSGSTGTSNSNKSSTNIGAIVGGVVGGVALLIAAALVALFFMRRRRLQNKNEKFRPDLLTADEGDDHTGAPRNELPQFYQPEPFMVADPTIGDRSSVGGLTADGRTDSQGRPLSMLTSERSGTPDPSTSVSGRTGKSAPMRQMRAVNVIQHADAGPSMAPGEEEAETVELPPAYTNIRKDLTRPSQSDLASAPLLDREPEARTATTTDPPPAS